MAFTGIMGFMVLTGIWAILLPALHAQRRSARSSALPVGRVRPPLKGVHAKVPEALCC